MDNVEQHVLCLLYEYHDPLCYLVYKLHVVCTYKFYSHFGPQNLYQQLWRGWGVEEKREQTHCNTSKHWGKEEMGVQASLLLLWCYQYPFHFLSLCVSSALIVLRLSVAGTTVNSPLHTRNQHIHTISTRTQYMAVCCTHVCLTCIRRQ